MQLDQSTLRRDPGFAELVRANTAARSCNADRPAMTATLDHFHHFAVARCRDVRIGQLEQAGREVASEWRLHREQAADAGRAFYLAVEALQRQAEALRPLITEELDAVISLAREPSHPLRQLLEEAASVLGFACAERDWFFGELERIGYRPVRLLCARGFADLMTLLHGVSVGELGLQRAGFARMTGDPDTDRELTRIVSHVRHRGATASVFLVLVVVLVADAVAQTAGNARHDAAVASLSSSVGPAGGPS